MAQRQRLTALERFRASVEEDGSYRKAGRRLGISASRIGQILAGGKPGGKSLTAIQREYLIPVTEW